MIGVYGKGFAKLKKPADESGKPFLKTVFTQDGKPMYYCTVVSYEKAEKGEKRLASYVPVQFFDKTTAEKIKDGDIVMFSGKLQAYPEKNADGQIIRNVVFIKANEFKIVGQPKKDDNNGKDEEHDEE